MQVIDKPSKRFNFECPIIRFIKNGNSNLNKEINGGRNKN